MATNTSDLLNGIETLLDVNASQLMEISELGIASKFTNYLNSFYSLFKGDNTIAATSSDITALTKSSLDLWIEIHDWFSKQSQYSGETIFKEENQAKIKALGIVSSVLSLTSSVIAASDKLDEKKLSEIIADYMDCGKDVFSIVEEVYKYKENPITELSDGGVYSPLGAYGAIAKACISSVSQLVRSIGEYSSDGNWTLEDTADTMIDFATAGLYEITHFLTLGLDEVIYSAIFKAAGKTGDVDYAKEIADGFKNIGDTIGITIGNFIANKIIDKRTKAMITFEVYGDALSIKGGTKADKLYGGDSNDTLKGGSGNDTLYGDMGKDKLYGGIGNDILYGGAGADSLYGESGNDKLYGGVGNDTLVGGAGKDTLTGGAGKDVFRYSNGDGDDTILDYVSGQDKIKIAGGSVSSYSVSGKDAVLKIGKGKITLKGIGNDKIEVITSDNKTVYYGGIATGLKFNNTNLQKATAVTISSAYSSKKFDSTNYSALVTLKASSRTKAIEIVGNKKANKIYGGSATDTLRGGDGKDTIYGGSGNDSIYGDKDADKLFGDAGNDTLIGGLGNDTLTGGAGKDVFYYSSGDGSDVIADYNANEDKIYINGVTSVTGSLKNSDVTFKVGNGSIKVQKAKGKTVTIAYSNGKEEKYINGKLTSSNMTIPKDALTYNGHSYYIYSNVANTWEAAQAYCEKLGGHLAVIDNKNENTALFNYMKNQGYDSAYFGLSDATQEGTWTWVTGDNISYTNWGEDNEPNGYTYENYGMFYSSVYTDGKWNDGDFNDSWTCNGGNAFICEWDGIKSSSSSEISEMLWFDEDSNFTNADMNIDSLLDENYTVTNIATPNDDLLSDEQLIFTYTPTEKQK